MKISNVSLVNCFKILMISPFPVLHHSPMQLILSAILIYLFIVVQNIKEYITHFLYLFTVSE